MLCSCARGCSSYCMILPCQHQHQHQHPALADIGLRATWYPTHESKCERESNARFKGAQFGKQSERERRVVSGYDGSCRVLGQTSDQLSAHASAVTRQPTGLGER